MKATNYLLAENGDFLTQEDGSKIIYSVDWTSHDALIDSLLTNIETYQDTYIQTHSVYFQGLDTCSVVPEDDTSADRLNLAPPHKITTWNDSGLIGQSYPFSVIIHEYVAPGVNKGYQVMFRSIAAEKVFVRSVGYGVEAVNRTFDWREEI